MWLANLKELKQKANLSCAQIAKLANMPEHTVARIFSGETPDPRVSTLHSIVKALGGSLDDILADTGAVLASTNLRAERDCLLAERDRLLEELAALVAEKDRLRMEIAQRDKIIATHEAYLKLLSKD